MFGNGEDDGEDEQEAEDTGEQESESQETYDLSEAINGDLVASGIYHSNAQRRAVGEVNGYSVAISMGHDSQRDEEMSGWAVRVVTRERESETDTVFGQEETNRYSTRFTAEAVFEKLVRVYDLEEVERE